MYKTFRVFLVLLIIVSFNTQMIYYGYAQSTVKIVTDPDIREIDISKQKEIKIIATEITQPVEWSLDGPGELKGEITEEGKIIGPAIFYIPPDKIDGKSAKVRVTITVIDDSGEKVTEKITFTLVAPTPESKKMSTGTKVALGAVAVAAFGGGIALAAAGGGDGDGDGSCGGVKVGGYCWYLGGTWIPCSSLCADHGGYNEATRTYAGSSGTDQNCWDVLTALGAPAATSRFQTDERADGCSYGESSEGVFWWRSVLPTTAEERSNHRACACNE
jgi:hypothetical protein